MFEIQVGDIGVAEISVTDIRVAEIRTENIPRINLFTWTNNFWSLKFKKLKKQWSSSLSCVPKVSRTVSSYKWEYEKRVRKSAGPHSGLQRDGSHHCVINICTSAAPGQVTAKWLLRCRASEPVLLISVCCSYFLHSELLDIQYTRLNLIAQS